VTEEQKKADPGDTIREGVRAVTGILGAFKDAIEQTFNDMSEKGDISPERAKEAARDAMKRAQEAVEDVRGRIEMVPRREFDALKAEVAELRARLDRYTGNSIGGTSSAGDGSPGL
jgi:polyhydroxyalkanoate synthesis regulator phasin